MGNSSRVCFRVISLALVAAAGCGGGTTPSDAGTPPNDASFDGGASDAGVGDAGTGADAFSTLDSGIDAALDGGATLDIVAEAARICELWTQNECMRRAFCDELVGLTVAECVTLHGAACPPAFERALALAAAGDATYDAAFVDVCTQPYPACNAFQSAAEACRGILVGAQADGATCSAPLGGLSGTCATGTCRPEGAACGTCMPRPAIGASCRSFEFALACQDGAVCMTGGSGGTCVARIALGGACSRAPFGGVDPCADGLVCASDGTCIDPPALGEACTVGCAPGSVCRGGTCSTPLHFRAEGDACAVDFECPVGIRCLPARGGGATVCRTASALDEACQPRGCADGLYCNVSGASTCRPYPDVPVGGACDAAACPVEAGACCARGLYCDGTSHCAAPTVHGVGEACSPPTVECSAPGSCDASGTCVGYAAVGAACTDPSDCRFGLSCQGSICVAPSLVCP